MIEADELMRLITIEDVIKIMTNMGSLPPKKDGNRGNLYFTTICHGGKKHKLHYFSDSKFFMCYTNCGSMSLYDVLCNINGWTFKESLMYVAKYKKIPLYKKRAGLIRKAYEIEDELKFLNRHLMTAKQIKKDVLLPSYDSHILNIFSNYYPDVWIEEGITESILKYYGVKFYFNQYKAIIPHYDIYGSLVGIKSRNFLKREIDGGKKYIPITVQGLTYRYPVQYNLYGIFQNKNNIIKYKNAILFESEKSVWKYGSFIGQERNIALAAQGMNISLFQRDMLLDLGAEDVTIAFDMQYKVDAEKDKNSQDYKEFIMYFKKIIKVVSLFVDYCNVYLILCWDNRLNYKDSPIDQGKEIFEELWKERYLVNSIQEIEELIY